MKKENFYNFHPDKIKVIDIVALGRASSVFFQGLLDGHSEIVVIPYETYRYKNNFNGDIDEISNYLFNLTIKSIKSYFNKSNIRFDEKIFKKSITKYLKRFGITRKTIFISLSYAYAIAINKKINKIQYICFQSHTFTKFTWILKDFKLNKIKLFCLIRDTRSSFYSIKRRKDLENPFKFHFTFLFFYSKFYLILKKFKKNNIIILRHEDIHTNYNKTLKEIIKHLKIEKEETLNYSSFFGIPYTGKNQKFSSYKNIYSAKPNPIYVSDEWRQKLSPQEIKFINLTSKKMLLENGYEITKNENKEIMKTIKIYSLIFLIAISQSYTIMKNYIYLLKYYFILLINIKKN